MRFKKSRPDLRAIRSVFALEVVLLRMLIFGVVRCAMLKTLNASAVSRTP
jgi:hypothetical protein